MLCDILVFISYDIASPASPVTACNTTYHIAQNFDGGKF